MGYDVCFPPVEDRYFFAAGLLNRLNQKVVKERTNKPVVIKGHDSGGQILEKEGGVIVKTTALTREDQLKRGEGTKLLANYGAELIDEGKQVLSGTSPVGLVEF